MAHSAEIRDQQRTTLASLRMVKMLGGDLDDAIAQAEAPMNEEDIAHVMKKIEEREKARSQKQQQ
jgi:hypothetical protein